MKLDNNKLWGERDSIHSQPGHLEMLGCIKHDP